MKNQVMPKVPVCQKAQVVMGSSVQNSAIQQQVQMRRTVPIWREAQHARDEANGMKQHKNNQRTMKTVITILKYVNELNFFNNVKKP